MYIKGLTIPSTTKRYITNVIYNIPKKRKYIKEKRSVRDFDFAG